MEVSSQHHALIILPPQRQNPVPTERKVTRVSQLVLMFWGKSTFLAPTKICTMINKPRHPPKGGLPGYSPPPPKSKLKKKTDFARMI